MLLERLLDHFDTYTVLHIDVNAVRDQLVDMGVSDEIRFHFVNMDKEKIRGFLYRYARHDVPYGEPILCADIVIAVDMGDEDEAWKRLVAVKELLHITDSPSLSAESERAVDNLYDRFSVPPELRRHSPLEVGNRSFLNDEVRIYAALAVLVPAGCRELLRQLKAEDKLEEWEIAQIAKVPARYIPILLNEGFDAFIRELITWEKSEQKTEKPTDSAANDSAESQSQTDAAKPAESASPRAVRRKPPRDPK
ncbi:hypothetical protein [Sphingomonas parapaucimobilis]|uniref:Uncharacterized protein n=1 Tax=Sphingomonas parapaucimobilis NBRC 15100 TaxID=1219049 RepID=A0A0A1W9E5_9SPHN|nr:hypothetical protein [Sphingomonas parapaucimobilis]GAM01953.1 hypothetical protein SP5_070_00360 [Sphingomonas parapaucimobilis NBRC 15100]